MSGGLWRDGVLTNCLFNKLFLNAFQQIGSFFLHFMFLLATMFKEIMCSGYKVLRWQTVYLPRLLLSSTNGQNTQNDNGVGISWSKHIYIWCHYDPQSFLKFRGAVYKSCTDNLFKKLKIRRKNNDCYNIVFSKECSK